MKQKKKKNNKYLISPKSFSFVILISWLIAIAVGSGVSALVQHFSPNSRSLNLVLMCLIYYGISAIISLPTAYFITKFSVKWINDVNTCLNKIAEGDFSAKLNINSKNEYISAVVENFNKTVSELNSVTILRNDFISNYSHEFKTPLVSIKGYAELLIQSTNLSEEEKEYAKIIVDESRRLSHLAEDTLTMSKLESQLEIKNVEMVNVKNQLEKMILTLDGSLKEKNISLNTELNYAIISGNSYMIYEIWLNIMINAIKYSYYGGEIYIYCGRENDKVVVKIKDKGIGMDEETLSHAFDKFYRSDKTGVKQGVGLGLAIVKRAVDLNGGEISIKSEIQKGTEFIISFNAI